MIPPLQALRFVFVMMIFMSHFAYRDLGAFEAGGDCGVAFFFLLSGFGLALGYGPRIGQGNFSYANYLRRRLLKVYPLHLLCLVAFLLLSHAQLDHRVALNALLLQCWVPLRDYYFSCNAVSWFLSCLLFCYLVFPWLYRHATWCWLAVVMSLCGIAYLAVPYHLVNNILYVNPLVRCTDFFLGVMLAKCYSERRLPPLPAWAELAVVLLLVIALVAYPFVDEKLRNAPLYWLVLIPLIFVFAHARGPLSALLSTSPMQFLGSLSMPIFLLHPMLMSAVMRRLPDMHYVPMLAACIAVVLFVSWMVDRLLLRKIAQLS
jgi:peptidoglycan/LPS O-acetylase OafA/YrhL